MMRITHHAPLGGSGNVATAAQQPVNITATYDAPGNTMTYAPNGGDITILHGNSGVITIQLSNDSTAKWVFDSCTITPQNGGPTNIFNTIVNPRTIVINDDNTGSHTVAYEYAYTIVMKNKQTNKTKTIDPKIQNDPGTPMA